MVNSELEGYDLIDFDPFLDLQKMKKFWESKGVSNVGDGVSGHMNLTWYGQKDKKEVVCQFGPSLKLYKETDLQGKESYGYFHPGKYVQAKEICKKAKDSGVPCPEILDAGYAESFTRAWCIAEKVQGANLHDLWPSLSVVKKIGILEQFGYYLGKLHSIPVKEFMPEPSGWYESWFNEIAHNLQVSEIYEKDELEKIKKAVLPNLVAYWLPPKFTFTHGDPLQKNIFVDSERTQITGIIDWETAGVGNPCADAILAAWWMSGEYGGNEEEYESVIRGYSQGLEDETLNLSVKRARAMNPYLDILWYLNILWVRPLMGDYSQTERRKGMVQKILEELK